MQTQKIEDIDVLVKRDHDYFRSLYDHFTTSQEYKVKQRIINELIRAISVHSVAEEIILYPAFEARLTAGEKTAKHSREEHQKLKYALYRLDRMHVSQSQFNVQLALVMNLLNEHMKEEETENLPSLRQACYESELMSLGQQFEETKKTVPTHPHPWAPNKPPFETIAGLFQAPIDKMYDYFVRDFPAQSQ